jgi:undecaprenyl-diphosphatase
VPAAITGALLSDLIEEQLGAIWLIGVMLIVFAVVLELADRLPSRRPSETFRLRDALLMGGAQAVALQPGVSRSGITISMGRWLGFQRGAAARLSFLMSLPIIAGAGLFEGAEVAADGGIPDNYVAPFIWGMIAAAISSFLVIGWLLRFLQTRSFMPFVIYRIVVGLAVIVIFGTGLR